MYCPWLQLKRCHCSDKLKLNWCIVSEELLFIMFVPSGFRSCSVISWYRSFLLCLLLNRNNISLMLYSALIPNWAPDIIMLEIFEQSQNPWYENIVDKHFTNVMTQLYNVVISIITINFYKKSLLTLNTNSHWYLEYIYLKCQLNIDYNILKYFNRFRR